VQVVGCLILCLNFLHGIKMKIILSETFLILRRIQCDAIIRANGLHVQCRLFLPDFNETTVSRHIFEKYSNLKYHENPSCGSRVVACERKDRQTDRHDGANSRSSEFANAAKNFCQECTVKIRPVIMTRLATSNA